MTAQEMKDFMLTQIEWINVAKYYEGQRLHCDPGEAFVKWWIKQNGSKFRKWWNENHQIQNNNKSKRKIKI